MAEGHSTDPPDPPKSVGPSLAAKPFWALMERWKVADADALQLIGFAGKIGKSGKRPRFRFLPAHKRATVFLVEIDIALEASGQSNEWLHRKIRAAPFSGRSPLAVIKAEGEVGLEKTLQYLHRSVWKSAISTGSN
jgi:hypothetical protein